MGSDRTSHGLPHSEAGSTAAISPVIESRECARRKNHVAGDLVFFNRIDPSETVNASQRSHSERPERTSREVPNAA